MIEASKRAGVERFVYGSTIGVYGEYAGEPLDENTPPRPLNVYGRSKLAAEEVVKSYRAELPTSIVRISETYGPGDFRLLKLFRALDRGRFVIIGSGQNRRQAIHVRDLVQGLLLAATHPAAVGETFVLAGQETMTTREMVEHVARALGRTAPRWHVPLWPFLAAAVVMEKTLSPLGIQPPLHRRRLDFFRKSFVFSTAKAQRLLGFTASVPFAAGTVETAHWYREQGYLAGQGPAGAGKRRRAALAAAGRSPTAAIFFDTMRTFLPYSRKMIRMRGLEHAGDGEPDVIERVFPEHVQLEREGFDALEPGQPEHLADAVFGQVVEVIDVVREVLRADQRIGAVHGVDDDAPAGAQRQAAHP